ncbi:hypothetical protein QJS04_geneDACA017112 [Acorus gramineus]|uniref:Uncharacterized protein n=1 Tax=Acorus gramineus TaxID=55184 RepID=A0AAV9AWR9_ACOGR|nr:hypothetical protein QJS04_geneDACA017112 [Acorus gramineus]
MKGVDKRKVLHPQPDTRTGCEAHIVIIYQSSVQVDAISDLGRRFQQLSHGLIQVASKASETDHSTELLKRRTKEIMEEVEIDLRTSSQNLQDDNEQHEVESNLNNEIAKGFKRRGKKTVGGKPQKRWIGALEKGSRGQSSQTQRVSQHASHIAIESPQTFAQGMRAPIVGNYDSSQGMTSMTQLLQIYEVTGLFSSLYIKGYAKLSNTQKVEWNNSGAPSRDVPPNITHGRADKEDRRPPKPTEEDELGLRRGAVGRRWWRGRRRRKAVVMGFERGAVVRAFEELGELE